MSKKILDDTGVSDLVNSIATNIANKYATKAIATQSANGLMSAADKTKLDNIIAKTDLLIIDSVNVVVTYIPIDSKVFNFSYETVSIINEYNSITDAAKAMGSINRRVQIKKCCQGKCKTAYKYKWGYKNDYKSNYKKIKY